MSGTLYIVATPIGNLGDISARCRETLESVDFIAAEDTRVTLKLLNHLEIKKPMVSYYEHNRAGSGQKIADRILAGESCALVTDAGTPAISDPGEDIVRLCRSLDIPVTAIPGPCAIIDALAISGMPTQRFTFEGFLSTNGKNRRQHLNELVGEKRTMVFYEAPHKLLKTLTDMLAVFGDRELALCRELTKLHEEVRVTSLQEAVNYYTENPPRGEFVLVIHGCTEAEEEMTMEQALELVDQLRSGGSSLKDAVKRVSSEHGISKNDLYDAALRSENG